MDHSTLYIILACVFGFFMAWGVGANDVANAMGTSVGSKALTIKQALLVAAIFEAAGAMLAGGGVTETIRSRIIDVHLLSTTPELLIFGMLAALLAAGTWLLIASYFGWPVSTTNSIVGAVIGFGAVTIGVHAVNWHVVIDIFLSWIITPVFGAVFAYLLFMSVQRLIFHAENPVLNAKRYVPFYIFLVAMIFSVVTLMAGVKHLGWHLSTASSWLLAVVISFIVTLVGAVFLRRIQQDHIDGHRKHFAMVEKIFGVLMIFTACAMAFAHGSNDVANAIGPLAAVVNIVGHHGSVGAPTPIPFWIMILGAIGIVLGLAMYGHKVMATIGTNITQLTPSRGFAAQLATASLVIIASGIGMPVSTTQTLVGAVLGVGFARGVGALNLGVIRNILMSWVITLPTGAILAIIYFYLIKALFSL